MQVEKERLKREELQWKAKDLQQKLLKLQDEKSDAEEKLLEVSNESFQVRLSLLLRCKVSIYLW